MSVEIVTTHQLNDGKVQKWEIGRIQKILYVNGTKEPFLALNSEKKIYNFSSQCFVDIENVVDISYGRDEADYKGFYGSRKLYLPGLSNNCNRNGVLHCRFFPPNHRFFSPCLFFIIFKFSSVLWCHT